MTPFLPVDLAAMESALEQARLALTTSDVPVGAVVIDETGAVIGVGRNEREALGDPTAHAEVLALRAAATRRRSARRPSRVARCPAPPAPASPPGSPSAGTRCRPDDGRWPQVLERRRVHQPGDDVPRRSLWKGRGPMAREHNAAGNPVITLGGAAQGEHGR